MVVMLLFCSTKMAAISLGDCDFGVHFNAIQRIKLQIGGKRICCMSIYIQEYYVYKLNRTLTLLGFVFCIGEPKGSVTD